MPETEYYKPELEENNQPLMIDIDAQTYEKLERIIEEVKNISSDLNTYLSRNIYVMESLPRGRYYFRSRIRTFAILEDLMTELQDRAKQIKDTFPMID